MKKKLVILAIDRDNDLYEKTNIMGPVIGRKKNLEAATKLALADPEEVDANTIFQALKLVDELGDKVDVEVATITGSKNLGYDADKTIAAQLERVLEQFPAGSCVVVSDGADDDTVLPIITSRIPVDSVKKVYMKQSKELEKTYVTLLDKLRDPYYARIILGIPALLLAMFAITSYLNMGWEPVALVIAIYMVAKLTGIEQKFIDVFKSFEFSVERFTSIIYVLGIVLIFISLWVSYQYYYRMIDVMPNFEKLVAGTIGSLLAIMVWGLFFIIIGKLIDSWRANRKFAMAKNGLYAVFVIIVWLLVGTVVDWVVLPRAPYVSFGDVLLTIIACLILSFISIKVMNKIKIDVLDNYKLEGKEALSSNGFYLGKVVAVDKKDNYLILQTPLGQRFNVDFKSVTDLGERVVVKK